MCRFGARSKRGRNNHDETQSGVFSLISGMPARLSNETCNFSRVDEAFDLATGRVPRANLVTCKVTAPQHTAG